MIPPFCDIFTNFSQVPNFEMKSSESISSGSDKIKLLTGSGKRIALSFSVRRLTRVIGSPHYSCALVSESVKPDQNFLPVTQISNRLVFSKYPCLLKSVGIFFLTYLSTLSIISFSLINVSIASIISRISLSLCLSLL